MLCLHIAGRHESGQSHAARPPETAYLSRPVEISSANSTRDGPTSISPPVTRFFCLQVPGVGAGVWEQ